MGVIVKLAAEQVVKLEIEVEITRPEYELYAQLVESGDGESMTRFLDEMASKYGLNSMDSIVEPASEIMRVELKD